MLGDVVLLRLVCLSMSFGGCVAICSCGHSQHFEGIICFRILSRSAIFCLSVDILVSACDMSSAVIRCDCM